MMTIWRSLLYMLVILFCLCGIAATAELTLTTGTPQSLSGTVNPGPETGASGISIMAAASDPDGYTLKNTLTLGSVPYSITRDSCGGSRKQVTHGELKRVHPRVYENGVVFEEWNAGNALVGRYDINSGTSGTMNPTGQEQTYPEGSGKLVVYEQDAAPGNSIKNVFVYDTQSQTSYQVSPSTTNQNQPDISGRYVVWQDWSSGNSDIALADLNNRRVDLNSGRYEQSIGQVNLICKDLGDQSHPVISGNYVVWEDWRNSNADIYMYDISAKQEYQLTNEPSDQKNPRISGNIVVWEDTRNGGSDIYAMDLRNQREFPLSGSGSAVNPDVSGALVVWEDDSASSSAIMLLDLITGRIYSLANDKFDQKSPSIFGGVVSWEEHSSGYSNIYILQLSGSGVNQGSSSRIPSGNYYFYGSATRSGSPVPVGSTVTAMIDGETAPRGSFKVDREGAYGSQNGQYLDIPVYADDAGKKLTFYIDGVQVEQTMVVATGGGTQMLDINAPYNTGYSMPVQDVVQGTPTGKYQLHGSLINSGNPVPVGSTITAMVEGSTTSRGTWTVDMAGSYGDQDGRYFEIPVYSGDVGRKLTFYVDGVPIDQTLVIGSGGGTQLLDLSTSYGSPITRYQFSGRVLVDSQSAPYGTVVSALVDGRVRTQVSVYSSGQYNNLNVPVYASDSGKYITFAATYNGAVYTTYQQVLINTRGTSGGSGGSGGVSLMSAGSSGTVSAEATVAQQLDLTFTSTTQSPTGYRFFGQAIIDGSPLESGRVIYAVVDGQARGQITITTPGQYGSSNGPFLEVPIYQSDVGKTIRFQTDTGSESDQTQLIVNGLTLSKTLTFSGKAASYAEFVATPVQGSAPLSVKFTDRSSGDPKSYYWDFGDGTTSKDKNPVHLYRNDGIYSVGLVTGYWNGQSKTVVKQNLIAVGAVTPPNAQIGLNPGWNFVSTPKMLADGMNNARAVFGRIDVGGHSIFTYNPRSKSWNTVTADTAVKPLDAFWIFSTKKDALNLYFAADALQIPPTRKLVKGWNTFGVTSLNTIPAYNTLLSIRDRWVYVIGYDSASQRFQNTIMNVPDSSQGSLYPGYGYWIYMSEDGDLAAVGL